MVAELDNSMYQSIAGEIRKNLPRHVYISPEYVSEEGRKVVRIWCRYPNAAKGVIERALITRGVEYDLINHD